MQPEWLKPEMRVFVIDTPLIEPVLLIYWSKFGVSGYVPLWNTPLDWTGPVTQSANRKKWLFTKAGVAALLSCAVLCVDVSLQICVLWLWGSDGDSAVTAQRASKQGGSVVWDVTPLCHNQMLLNRNTLTMWNTPIFTLSCWPGRFSGLACDILYICKLCQPTHMS